jgi:hypothetical protein
MGTLSILAVILLILIAAYVVFSRRSYNKAVEAGEIVPAPGPGKSEVDVHSPSFGQYVTVNLTMMSGGVVFATWNEDRSIFTVSVSEPPGEDGREKIEQFVERLRTENPIDIRLKYMP